MSQWLIVFDLNQISINEDKTSHAAVYSKIEECMLKHGFYMRLQTHIYASADDKDSLARIYRIIQELGNIRESQYLTQLHVFRTRGSINNVLPFVTDPNRKIK